MHDPNSVAHEICLGSKKKKNGQYRSPFITIWHRDPEKDGTDDSCGWFIRGRHIDQGVIEAVVNSFEFEWDRTFTAEGRTYNRGWFNPEGENVLSVQGIVLNMYVLAAKAVYGMHKPDSVPDRVWKKVWNFINKHHAEISYFAENTTDSLRDTILRVFAIGTNTPYTEKYRQEMIRECAAIVTTDIYRKIRPWYKHPRWHIHHWRIQFHPWQNLKRRYWDKCSVCGKRGFKGAAHGDWSGTKIWHEHCDESSKNLTPKSL